MIETDIDRVVGENYCCISTGEKKFINKLNKFAEEYPDDVKICYVNEDGSIVAHVPFDWFKFVKPPIKRNYTDEQKEAMKARMKKAREVKDNG